MLSRVLKTALFCISAGAIGITLYLWEMHGQPMQRGVLATVNGQPITVQRVQLQVDLQHPPGPETTFETMRTAHMQVLGSLIVTRLMEQDLRDSGQLPDDATLDAAARASLADYPPEELGQTFSDAGISEADWLAFMRDTRIAAIFEKHVLQNRMHMDLAAVREYYDNHRGQFALPDTVGFCSVRSADKASVEQLCASLGKGPQTRDGQPRDNQPELIPACTAVPRDELPEQLQSLAKRDRRNVCGKIEQFDDVWQAAWLVGPRKGEAVPLAAAYALIENLLRDSGKYAAFGAWLEQAISKADIRLAPEVAPDLLNLQTVEKRLSKPVTETSEPKRASKQ